MTNLEIPDAAAAALLQHGNKVLSFDPADVETVVFGSPFDVIELPPESADAPVRRKLGQQTVELTIRMKPGTQALWVDKE